jgi:signal peptidase I
MTAVSLAAQPLQPLNHELDHDLIQGRNQNRITRTVERLAEGVVTLVLVLSVACLLISALPGFFGFGTVRVMGASMGRAIPVGSVAVLGRVSAEGTKVGDVILFSGKGAEVPVMHRVVSITRTKGASIAITRGDANTAPDPSPRRLTGTGGKVVASVPFVGFVLTALRVKLVWVLIVLAMVRRVAKVSDSTR